MNILVYSHTPLWEVHHAESIEICLREIEKGNKVLLLSCDGALKSCPANVFKSDKLCKKCVKQTNYSVSNILRGKVIDIRLKLSESNKLKLNDFETLNDVENFSYLGIPYGELVVSQITDTFQDVFIPLSELHDKGFPAIDSLITNSIALYDETKKIIDNFEVDEVYVWNGRRFCDGPVLYAAKNSCISYHSYISGRKNSYITLPTLKVHDLSYAKNIIEDTYQKILAKYGLEYVENIADEFFYKSRYGGFNYQGAANFADKHRIEPDSLVDIVIFPGSYWEYFGMSDYTHKIYPNPYEGLRRILTDESLPADKKIAIRWHPNLTGAGIYERGLIDAIILETNNENIIHYPPSSLVNTYSLMANAKIVVTFGSTLGVQANYYGKPSVLLGRMSYEDLGITYNPSSHEQTMEFLRSNLKAHPKLGSLKYAVFQMASEQIEFEFLSQCKSGRFYLNKKRLAIVSISNLLKGFIIKYIPIGVICFLRKFYNIKN